jgi:hypothetical protein
MGRNTTRSGLAPAAAGLLGATTVAVLLVSILAAQGATPEGAPAPNGAIATPRARTETLWIFDADFEDLVGDNAGWTTTDMSGRPPCPNYWHKDTIRLTEEYLGDSTWWCGTSNPCWIQPRGYGNDWTCYLVRDFPLSQWSQPGDYVELEWDQRYAMEARYDYGYLDVSPDVGATWETIAIYTNLSWFPGAPVYWTSPKGHPVHELDSYAGTDIRLRFRVESDCVVSSEDQYYHSLQSFRDGAWQIDNIEISVNGGTVWLDDCESPGDNGWLHEDFPGEGQTGVVFRRVYEEFEDPYTREVHASWMMAPYDSLLGGLVDGQDCLLTSRPVDVSGAPQFVGEWIGWLDLTPGSYERAWARCHQMEDPACAGEGRIRYMGVESDVPQWVTFRRNWDAMAGHDWLEIGLAVGSGSVCDSRPRQGLGFVLDRLRVGVPIETSVPDEGSGECRLALAGPSPFATSTVIAYATALPGHITVRVHDLSGRVVRTLLDRVITAGAHELVWDGTNDSGERAASGVYFVRMEMDGFGASEKLVLLR